MNVVKFYHRDTGKLRRAKVKQRKPIASISKFKKSNPNKYYSLPDTERMMASVGYFRQRPKATA